ncbi:MAG: NAD-dependent epimerase/dehydratase family protein [Nanoarchaeota archaeon]
MKKALITGGMGFIGSHLARNLVRAGDDVTILSRSDKRANISDIVGSVKVVLKDVRDISPNDVGESDHVYHLAGTVDNYAVENGEPFRDVEVNCVGTQALLEACRLSATKPRIFFGSTFFVYGNLKSLPATVDSPTNPLSLYAATRLCAENMCQIYNRTYGLDTVIARFTNVFGPGDINASKQKGAFDWMIGSAVKGEKIKVYDNGDFIRDFIYVDDAVEACKTLISEGEKGGVYNIGRGPVKFADLIEMLREKVPGMETEAMPPPQHHVNVGTKNFYADSGTTRALGWEPNVSLDEGIFRTVEYYRKNRSLS